MITAWRVLYARVAAVLFLAVSKFVTVHFFYASRGCCSANVGVSPQTDAALARGAVFEINYAQALQSECVVVAFFIKSS